MTRTPEDETLAALERLRAELPAAIAARRADEVAYFGTAEPVPDPRDLDLWIDVREDGLPDLVVDCTIHDGRRPPRMRARFRFDPEWRRAAEAGRGGIADRVARGLVLGGAYETDAERPTSEERAAAEAALPDAAALWADLPRLCGGTAEGDRVRIRRTTVLLSPEQWREHVVDWEVAARRDRGTDAMRPGNGPAAAAADLEETVASTGAPYVVWWRGEPHPSRRPELPPA
jgi:hypothetical protein